MREQKTQINVLSESFLYLLLWLISRQSHPNFINVRAAAIFTSGCIQKNLILGCFDHSYHFFFTFHLTAANALPQRDLLYTHL